MSAWMLSCPLPGIPCAGDPPTPHTTGRLLAVSRDMAELLAILTVRESIMVFVRLYPDCSMAKACHVVDVVFQPPVALILIHDMYIGRLVVH